MPNSKSKTTTKVIKITTIGDLIQTIERMVAECIDPALLKHRNDLPANFNIGFESTPSWRIRLYTNVRHGPFNEIQKTIHSHDYTLEYMNDEDKIRNFIFHSLTFNGSPFYFRDGKFHKRMELAG